MNNVFTGNYAEYSGGIFIYGYARPEIFNNLFHDNAAVDTGMGDTGAIYCFATEGSETFGTVEPPAPASPFPVDEMTAVYEAAAERIVKLCSPEGLLEWRYGGHRGDRMLPGGQGARSRKPAH
jgi:hypothetical protein